MEVPSESFHRSSWDSRTCYPRRAFNQGLTDAIMWEMGLVVEWNRVERSVKAQGGIVRTDRISPAYRSVPYPPSLTVRSGLFLRSLTHHALSLSLTMFAPSTPSPYWLILTRQQEEFADTRQLMLGHIMAQCEWGSIANDGCWGSERETE